MPPPDDELARTADGHVYGFSAMASPCEVRVKSTDAEVARAIGVAVAREARRIEAKYSRYRPDSVVSAINTSGGAPMDVDDETARLLDYAGQCHALSEGRFDITSGVLRRIWRFDGSDNVPDAAQVEALLPLVGWRRLSWRHGGVPRLVLPAGMEIDLGGLGKEYAVDCATRIARAIADVPALVNFGGDLCVTRPLPDDGRWTAAIEAIDSDDTARAMLAISGGALTTSGDARRYLLRDGVRYSHILDPRTGWPVVDPPRSVTVAAPTCIEAGFLSTLAMLHGREAEAFLGRESVAAWVRR